MASTLIANEAHPEANIIWGAAFDPELEDEMRITIIATGFEKKPEDATRRIPGVTTNPESPFKKDAPKASADAAKTAQKPAEGTHVKKVVKTVRPVQKKAEDDDFDDILAMMRNTKK